LPLNQRITKASSSLLQNFIHCEWLGANNQKRNENKKAVKNLN